MISCSTSRCPFVAPFFKKWLNIFDLSHACASIFSVFLMLFTTYAQGDGSFVESFPALKMLRIARLMRIFKLFRRVRALSMIINSIAKASIALSNAMALMFTFTVGYAIIGTHLFRERSPEYFGNLAASLFTLCQVITCPRPSTLS